MHHNRSDYDFDVISGPAIRLPAPPPGPTPPASSPRPAGAAPAPASHPDGTAEKDEAA